MRTRTVRWAADGGCVNDDPCTAAVLELRRYTLHPGQRDVLVDVFDRWFVTGQEAAGMRIVGQFCDVAAPDQFVWLRGFPTMEQRTAALQSFYGGPVWAQHQDVANATMIDWTDVLLLQPLAPATALGPELPCTSGRVGLAVLPLPGPLAAAARSVVVQKVADDPSIVGAYVSLHAVNGFPALPVRDAEVLVLCFDGPAALAPEVEALGDGEAQLVELIPTAGSRWGGHEARVLPARTSR